MPSPIVLASAAILGVAIGGACLPGDPPVRAFRIASASMQPTLESGDDFIIDRTRSQPGRGDVIVFRDPRDSGQDFVKRVVAVAGDTVAVRHGTLFVNGAAEAVPDRRRSPVAEDASSVGDFAAERPEVVPAESVFVLGDNRANSFDSRHFGAVPLANVKGKVLFVYWSAAPDRVRWERIGHAVE